MTHRTESAARPRPAAWQRALPWLITIACFAWLYTRLDAAADRAGQTLIAYLSGVFSSVSWSRWLLMMIPYSAFYFLVDSTVVWRVVRWFNAPVRFADILPIRASTYILSIVNEQVGKGVIAYYLHRRHGVPGWQVGSSMLFIMFCELYYLLFWATLGVALRWERLPAVFHVIPSIAAAALVFLIGWILFFRGRLPFGAALRRRDILSAFRRASLGHYAAVIAMRSPALLAAVIVYTLALHLFGVEAQWLDMLGILPVIFFGAATPGPMRSVAIVLWVTLFPENAGPMAAFGFVQHNFFIFFNAAIGLLFLRRANRELFG
ncbi:MAG: hypothetical protein OEM49_00420 [Myxococcales bacterium]|nr:hypothetical protein [Myxococcales bacterium]MDH5306370.1 hypothetical protein [Myxococcales bacterium]MDH5565378.1 hypothetical protein [Myxococcales bacterium]